MTWCGSQTKQSQQLWKQWAKVLVLATNHQENREPLHQHSPVDCVLIIVVISVVTCDVIILQSQVTVLLCQSYWTSMYHSESGRSSYQIFGTFLHNDKRGDKMAVVENDCRGKAKDITREILRRWHECDMGESCYCSEEMWTSSGRPDWDDSCET